MSIAHLNIAFIGVGNMGRPMAHNLLKAGHSVVVYDVVQRNVDALVAAGAGAAASARLAASRGDLVITMLPSSPHVRERVLGRGRRARRAWPAA